LLFLESLVETDQDAAKFDRFATRVLGAGADASAKAQVKAALDPLAGALAGAVAALKASVVVAEGPGRFDVVDTTANQHFGPFNPATNFKPAGAPTSTPSVWATGGWKFIHWNASGSDRMGRNALQTMGWDIQFSVQRPEATRFQSIYNLEGTKKSVDLSAKLHPPRWPAALFGAIDGDAQRRGAKAYAKYCDTCHEPQHEGDLVVLQEFPIGKVGTDTAYTTAFARTLDLTALGQGTNVSLAKGLSFVTSAVLNQRYAELNISPEEQQRLSGGLSNDWRQTDAIHAVPLAGVWANAPYLHNGSVASLHDLLLPASKRAPKFFVGGKREFDPINVGYDTTQPGFEVDTSKPGNQTVGHEFGTDMSEAERLDLIAYLKGL
jgi:hypothetical protein